MDAGVQASMIQLLQNPNLSPTNRTFLMSPQFSASPTAQQRATLVAFAQQAATAAAAPAPAAAAPTHQDNVNTAQNDAAASRIALGLPQCHCYFPRSLSSTQSASGSSTGSTAPRAIKTDVRARRGRSGKASLLEYRAGRRRQHADKAS